MNYSNYNKLRIHLKKKLPLTHPVKIRRTILPDDIDGLASFANNIFCIKINRNLDEKAAIDALIHEMSHCLVLETHQGHGIKWGIAFSKVYKKYLEWLNQNEENFDC